MVKEPIWNNDGKGGVGIPQAQTRSETARERVTMKRKKGDIRSTQV